MPAISSSDEQFMYVALKLAQKAEGWTNPNPMVGAVIVKDNKIIGQGYHHKVGSPHAEVAALQENKTSLRGATLYVNLEPCSHHGRTPPCSQAIIAAGISRVVCATTDPNPQVAGQGIVELRAAGITVEVGLGVERARQLNEAFLSFHAKRRPFVALKFASSLDGKLATRTGDSKWITNEAARKYARGLRAQYQAILVGINTVLSDDPQLGARQRGKKDPLRVILDSQLRIPLNSQVLRDANVIVATTTHAPRDKKQLLERQGVRMLTFKSNSIPVNELLQSLRQQEIISVLVEGGGQVLGSFIDARAVDKVYAFYAPLLVGGTGSVSLHGRGATTIQESMRFKDVSFKHFQDNWLVSGYPEV